MRTFYRLFILIITIAFLTTYNPSRIDFFPKNEILFLKIKSIKITNNKTISTNEIIDKLLKSPDDSKDFLSRMYL